MAENVETKTLNTRIKLKYDSYAAWTTDPGKNLVLLPGEIGICAIETKSQGAQTAPTVLFKVGDGEHKFHELKWASALAADVYTWAKSETVELFIEKNAEGSETGKREIRFKTGDTVNHSIDLSDFATDADISSLASRIAAVEAKFSGDASVEGQISALDSRLDAIEGENGTIAQAEAAAKAYTDTREAAIKTAYEAYADQAETDAKAYADTELAKDRARITVVEETLETVNGSATTEGSFRKAVADAVTEVKAYADTAEADAKAYTDTREAAIETAYKAYADQAETDANTYSDGKLAAAVQTINAKDADQDDEIAKKLDKTTYNSYIAGKSMSDEELKAYADSKAGAAQAAAEANAATTAQGKVDALANGAVKTNAANITANADAIEAEAKARSEKDANLESRLVEVEAFFKTTENQTLDTALDTLVEIQDYLNGDGSATGGMIDRLAQAESDIDALEKTLAKDGDFEKRVAAVEAKAAANEEAIGDNADAIKALQDLTAGFGEGETVQSKIATAQKAADDAQKAADDAQDAADKAQGEVDALEGVVAGVKSTADTAKADLAALTGEGGRIATIEGEIDDLQADSHTHANKSELDLIASGDKAKWDDAYGKRHTHSFVEAELNNIKSGDVAKWNTAATTAAQAAADIAALTAEDGRIATAESDIDALEAIVKTGANTNAQLRSDITELQGIVKTGADANATLRSDLTTLKNAVEHSTTGLAATKAIADEAKSDAEDAQTRVAAIEADYLKEADLFIIDCGTSTKNIHQ
jgi:hypothetical protein